MFQSDKIRALEREVEELRELCYVYKTKIAEKEQDSGRFEYITVNKPPKEDMIEYYRAVAGFVESANIRYYLTNVREEVIKAFSVQGKEYSEFFRGKLSAIRDIVIDAKNSKKIYEEMILGGKREI